MIYEDLIHSYSKENQIQYLITDTFTGKSLLRSQSNQWMSLHTSMKRTLSEVGRILSFLIQSPQWIDTGMVTPLLYP